MKYISTRGGKESFSSAEAIRQGIAPDGGLFVPEKIPVVTMEEIIGLSGQDYIHRAVKILGLFLDDYPEAELYEYAAAAYSEEKFGTHPAPLVQLNKYSDQDYILELWHGPTAAFKDIALQILPYLMTAAVKKTSSAEKVCILAATSGDTGKAALEGFRDVDGTSVVVFYPAEGVSPAQKLQMVTQEGDNCLVAAVNGSFDDTQSGVKAIFADSELNSELKEKGIILSSANSINWGRLVPQIVYYFSVYADLLSLEKIEPGDKINLVVPTGNFGNILAAWYASRMGLPVNKLICASNRNKVLSDFIRNGKYDSKRQFFQTNSPSMDILISSNLERLLFEITGHDSEKINSWMQELQQSGSYEIDNTTLRHLQTLFVGGFADDAGTVRTIREVYDKYDHLVDTHTAVGFNVFSRYAARSGDKTKTIFVATASPFKFSEPVSDALFGNGYNKGRSEATLLTELARESDLEIPASLRGLNERPVRHELRINPEEMRELVKEKLTGGS